MDEKKKVLNEKLEIKFNSVACSFEKMSEDYVFMKEKLVDFDTEDDLEKININFKECHVAIGQNGGLIAICKKKGFLDITRGSKINNYIIVMYQNKKRRYLIPIDWNYKERWVVDLEFNEKEQLYAICNDGLIYKINLLTQRAIPKKSSDFFKNQPIVKAKLVEKGFIALTVDGNFLYSKDIKNPVPKLIFPMGSLLQFTNNVEFLTIPSNKSKSQRLELLIINQKGDGVIHIEDTEGEGQFSLTPVENEPGKMECKGASIIIKNKVETYYLDVEEKKKPEIQVPGEQYENLGRIAALAISPEKDQLAIYDPRGYVFFFYINFEEGGNRKRANVTINGDCSSEELLEQQKVINFEEGCEFLYCGKDAVAICGFRYIFLINTLGITLIFKITDKEISDLSFGASLSKCISEVDGIRYLTNEGVFFLGRVSKELVEICDPFVDSKKSCSKPLLEAYQSSLDKDTNSEKIIRDLKYDIGSGIYNLLIAAANLFWTKSDKNQEKKNIQLFLLEAAQNAKCFVKKDLFNFEKFYLMCKDIRTINNLRNSTYKPKLITYNEYKKLETRDLILKVIRSLNFGLAFKISQYFDEEIKLVYEKYCIACIKKIADKNDTEEENKIFELLNDKLKNIKHFSYINLAKKAFKYHKDIIGMKFLENEKSLLAKLPKYIDKEEWDKVLELSENIYDNNIIMSILEKTFKKTTLSDFIKIAGKHPNLKDFFIEFLKKNAPEKLDEYMELLKSPEEMFFFALEQYFQSTKFTDRKKYIKLARENQKLIDNIVNPNFEHKFYKSYLDSLENNLSFKIECLNLDKTVITKADDTSFDISIYDTYKYGVKAEKYNWIESQNKHFNFSPEGMIIMRLISYGEMGSLGLIETLVKKNNNNLKKLNLSSLNLVEIYFKFKAYKEAAEYIKNINEPFYFEYKIDMLKSMEKPEIVLEVIIADKNVENNIDFVKEIINGKPKLLRLAQKLAEKNKVNLNLE